MGRAFYPHEADDPDLDWLVSNFLYERPDFLPVESGMLPLVLIPYLDNMVDEMDEVYCSLQGEESHGEKLLSEEENN